MVTIVLKFPDDLNWIIKNKEGLKWVEAAIINRLTDIKIGNLMAEKSELKDEDIDEIDHKVKRALYKTIKAEK
jgi:hypothetical protein